ncbi:Bgt-65 [Blumeria graminis f. sp. tritici]|uniref:GPI ethanolamine phosphate transferase 2 n=2 Tax=Blumeria graminis f. sp. tritici TaxID=62690 RepID=A0A381L954_BLUGR|nr:Integral plasma membrane protein [Blumeria graminis f. sp. tritici 96224]VDB84426.1 Bgt-65 [Blumeria graminis f. sp. tritici]
MLPCLTQFLLLIPNSLLPVATIIFASGFFPYKPHLPGFANNEPWKNGSSPEAPFDKIIFMVVDALRSLISSGSAIPFTAHAKPPTITMPRIKALSTGSLPSFIDVILNFAESESSSLFSQDTWLTQMKSKGTGKLLMYGDDTWLKLFPGTFDRMDGTSSFFVSDFTEVDTNVTRHIPRELRNRDWNTMVLHFLGLDHIGHKSGPQSLNMIPKQNEMDGIVKQIYDALSKFDHLQSTLLVLLGDHGMNDAGNHGGSSSGETSPALVFISPKLRSISTKLEAPSLRCDDFRYYSVVDQTDIAPTLGALLGFPIPKNSLGVFIPGFLSFWSDEQDRIQILLSNAKQIVALVSAKFITLDSDTNNDQCNLSKDVVEELFCRWKTIVRNTPKKGAEIKLIQRWKNDITEWLKQAQELLSASSSNYNVLKLGVGLAVIILAMGISIAVAILLIGEGLRAYFFLFIITLLHGTMMFASSYVEEEQNFWHWITNAWLLLLWMKRYVSYLGLTSYSHNASSVRQGLVTHHSIQFLLILLAVRIARRWNQTGQKFAGEPDIANNFFPGHCTTLWCLVGIAYFWNLWNIKRLCFPQLPPFLASIFATTLSACAVNFKIVFTREAAPEILNHTLRAIANSGVGLSLVAQARILFTLLGIALSLSIYYNLKFNNHENRVAHSIHHLLTLFLYTQARVENIPLLMVFEIILVLMSGQHLNPAEITTTSLVLQHMSFFSLGGSNAISSIDLSNAYNGLRDYNIISVGILTFISNWAGPIFWTSGTSLILLRSQQTAADNLWAGHITLITLCTTSSLAFVMLACTQLRSHLFIWTVFSPKLLYSIAWSLGQHLLINVGYGGTIFKIGRRSIAI